MKNELSIGDEVYCICDNFCTYGLLNLKGKRYIINDVRYNKYLISCDCDVYKSGIFYYLDNIDTFQMFSKHFLTKKEYRKYKLEKLSR